VFLDVYGFSAMVEREMSAPIQKRLIDAHKKARRLIKNRSPETIYLFISDSTCLVYPVPHRTDALACLDQCAADVSEIMDLFFKSGLPVRGAAAFGEVAYGDNILVGRPVLRAVNLEKSLPFPLVAVPLHEIYPSGRKRSELEEWGRCTLHQIAVRPEGKMHALLIFPSELDEFAQYVEGTLDDCLTTGPPAVASAWALTNEYVTTHIERLKRRR
jgi:hypothetical protein